MSNIIPSPNIFTFFYDQDGHPLAGGKLYTYIAGTTTPKDTYTDSSGDFVNPNPIILDANGGCTIFIMTNNEETGETSDAYSFVLYDKDNNLIKTASNIYSAKGEKGTPGGPKGDRGPKGDTGIKGVVGARGYTGPKGIQGPQGDNGSQTHIFRTAGTYNFVVPDGVSEIDYEMCGGGGGFYTANPLPYINEGATGTAGKTMRGKLTNIAGATLNIVVGAGGLVTINNVLANGQDTTISGVNISLIRAEGGKAGTNASVGPSDVFFQKIPPFLNFTTFEGTAYNIIPNALFGESSPWGDGGNIYDNNPPNGQGNGSSGGTSIPYFQSNAMKIDTAGAGAPGIVILTFFVDNSN